MSESIDPGYDSISGHLMGLGIVTFEGYANRDIRRRGLLGMGSKLYRHFINIISTPHIASAEVKRNKD